MIILSSDKSFSKNLETLTNLQTRLPPNYTKTALKYYSQRPFDEGQKAREKSFVLLFQEKPIIAFIGALMEQNSNVDLLAYEVPCITIESRESIPPKVFKKFLNEINKIIESLNGTLWYRDFLSNGKVSPLSRHLLLKGAKCSSLFTQVIDLFQNEATIKSNVRHSFRSLINWGLGELHIQVFDSSNMDFEKMLQFRKLHIREAGRETRSEESWKRQLEIVQADQGFTVFGHLGDELVSAGFFIHNKTNCYYCSSASRRDMFEKSLFHSLMWTAIIHAKKIGCRWFETGEQLYPNHPNDKSPTSKELGISLFKSGFGGQTEMFLDLKLDCNIKQIDKS